MGIEGDHLVVGRTIDLLLTRFLVDLLVVIQRENEVGTIVVAPCRLESGILILIRSGIARLVVDGNKSMEAQALQQRAEVGIHTSIELELTTGPCALSSSIVVGKDIGQVCLCTSQEILTVDDIVRRCQCLLGLNGIRIQIGDRDQRSHTVRTPLGSHLPVITVDILAIDGFLLGRNGCVLVVERSVGIHVGRDPLVDLHVYVTAYIETVGIVIFGLTEVQIVTLAVIAYVGVELRTVVTTLDLNGSI